VSSLGAGYGQAGPPQAGYGKPPSQPGYDSAGGYGMPSDAGGAGYGQRGGDRGSGEVQFTVLFMRTFD